jgi:hypothetical protein
MPTRLSTVVLCLLVSLAAATAAAAADVNKLAQLYENPTLGAPKTISNTPVRIGSLELTLTSGTIAPVKAGDHTIGVFFSGNGKFTYKSTDPVERSLVQFEAKKLDRVATVTRHAVTITGTLDRVLIRAGGIELPTGEGAEVASGGLAPAFKKHRDDFGNVLWQPPSHLLLRQRFDAPASPVAVVEIGTGRDSQGYILDTIDDKEERFFALITRNGLYNMADLRGALFPVTISEQPVGRTRGAFVQPRYLLVNLDYTLIAGEKANAKLSTTETIVPRATPQSVFRFNLITGKRDAAGNIRALQVDAVTDDKGKPLPFDFNYGSLLVGLPAKAAADQPLVLKFQISGDFLIRPDNASFWQLGTEAWFPQPDLNGQYYTVHSIVKIKKPWVAFASGETVKRSEEGDYNVFENAFDKPLQFAVVHGGKYTVHEEKFEGLTVKVAPYAGINAAQVKQLARLAHTMIKFYEPWLGPFPFKEFHIEINDLGWGQAPPGMMFITQEAFNPMSTSETRAYSKGVNQRFAHEIAHQYWGIAVKMSSEEDQWFTEAFSEFSSALVMNQIDGKRGYDNIVNTWRAEGRDGGNFAPIVLANRIATPADPLVAFQHYINLTYGKGAYVLAVLRKELGDTKFFSWMRTMQGQFGWKFMTTENAAALLTRMDNGKNHQPFFDKYVFGTETPVMPK